MSTLTAANQARLRKSLDKLIRYDGRIMTTEQFINEVAVDFREKSEPKIYFNRRKFNRMDWDEQHEYNKKLEERKTVYSAITEDGGLYDIPKIVYNHFVKLNK